MPKYVMPDEDVRDTSWFERLNPFGQQETPRQGLFIRTNWPFLEDGTRRSHVRLSYPHILPVSFIRKALYEQVDGSVLAYFEEAY